MNPVVIAGMHRSGTSLAAALLESAGVHMGEHLLGKRRGNPGGHFEDLDFVVFHQELLADAGESSSGWSLRAGLPVSRDRAKAAQALVERKNARGILWGWKDPRSTLFLPFWADLLADAAFVLPFRPPWAVMDSLYRRGDFEFFWDPARALDIWIHYNRLVLEFARSRPDRAMVVCVDALLDSPVQCIRSMGRRFRTQLRDPHPLIAHPLSMRRIAPEPAVVDAIQSRCPEALSILNDLNAAQPDHFRSEPFSWTCRSVSLAEADAVFENLMSSRREEFVSAIKAVSL
jgi:O-antigen biosynthesis protein